MSYRIVDIDLKDPVLEVLVAAPDSGVAVLVRYQGRPLAFWMEKLATGRVMTSGEMTLRVAEKAGTRLVGEKLREELLTPDPPEKLPSLTIAVCTKDHPEQLARCLDSILAACQSATGWGGVYEVIVIDNSPSDDRTREMVAARASVRYVLEQKTGLDFARNRALQEASGELLAYLDDDVVMDPEWPGGLAEAWAQNRDAGGFTGLILPYELVTEAQIVFEGAGGFRIAFDAGFDKLRFNRRVQTNWRYPFESGVFGAGANMVFRRQVLLELGGFDEALDTGRPLPGGGDLDIFFRVVRAGHCIAYEPRCLVFHEHRRDLPALRRQCWGWGLGFMAFVGKLYRTEKAERPMLRRLVLWWFRYHGRQFLVALRQPVGFPPHFVARQICGGLQGLCGEYGRSLRRVEKIRARFQ